ncbi:MAG: hypothetical protein MUQ56_12430, partial [Thermoleophilia bacterium]|nr:hypothetical protein [Thermoleophilia bacterium]
GAQDRRGTGHRGGGERRPASSLREKGWQCRLGIDATVTSEEYEFWGEKLPRTVDDPQDTQRALEKWGAKLGRGAAPTGSAPRTP